MWPGISFVVPGDFSQTGRYTNYEFTDWTDYGFIITVLVIVEPDPVVVVSKVFEKIEKIFGKTVKYCHARCSLKWRKIRLGELAGAVGFMFFFLL